MEVDALQIVKQTEWWNWKKFLESVDVRFWQ